MVHWQGADILVEQLSCLSAAHLLVRCKTSKCGCRWAQLVAAISGGLTATPPANLLLLAALDVLWRGICMLKCGNQLHFANIFANQVRTGQVAGISLDFCP